MSTQDKPDLDHLLLYERVSRVVRIFAKGPVGIHDVEDIVHDAVLLLYQHLDRCETPSRWR